jgi:rubrerythrin
MARTREAEAAGGTRDTTYNLISVAYHALQGAETSGLFALDAEQEGDAELAQFHRDLADQDRQRADRAKQLLATRLGKGGRG